jgi:hypothetical protein
LSQGDVVEAYPVTVPQNRDILFPNDTPEPALSYLVKLCDLGQGEKA